MTTTQDLTIQSALNEANPSRGWAAVQQAKLGDALQGFVKTITGLSDVAAHDLTTIDDPDDTTKKLPAALVVAALRVTAGSAVAGARIVTDAGGTPAANTPATNPIGLATLSADGKTITFEAGVTAFVIHYVPKQDLTAKLERE